MARENFIADEKHFDRGGGLELTALLCGVLDLRGEGLELLDLVGEIAERLGDLIQRSDLVLGVAGLAELVNKSTARIHRDLKKNIRIGFFRGDLEMSVRLHLFLHPVPPLFKSGGVENFGLKCNSDLVGGCFTTEVDQDFPRERKRVFLRLIPNALGIGRLLREDMVLRNRRQCFSRISDLHRVLFFGPEINEDLARNEVPLRHTPESPAFVLAIGAGGKAVEGVCGFLVKGAALHGLGEFVCHSPHFTRKPPDMQGEQNLRPGSRVSGGGDFRRLISRTAGAILDSRYFPDSACQ